MTVRAVVLGFAIAMFVAAFTYFNDQVIGQTYLIGNHLPASVFGAGILLAMVGNPLLGLLGIRRLSAGEVAIAVALGLAVCGWPGSNLLRYFSGVVTKPTTVDATKPLWQAQRVMSYLPGGRALLAEGFVTDWPGFVAELQDAGGQGQVSGGAISGGGDSGGGGAPALARIVERMPYAEKRVLLTLEPGQAVRAEDRRTVVNGINAALQQRDLFDEETLAGLRLGEAARRVLRTEPAARERAAVEGLNRAALVAAAPEFVRPAPRGAGLLLNDGEPHRAVDLIIGGDQSRDRTTPMDVPWAVWWPTLRLWLGTSLLLGLASLCMVVVVHPQWSQRELLPYPTVRFLQEVTEPQPNGWLPAVAHQRLFWVGFATVLGIHTLNGLHAWFPALPTVVRQYDLWGLATLFPNARTVNGSSGLWNPAVYFAVIGFGFFIPTNVSLSLGLSLVLWVALGAFMLSSGGRLESEHFDFDANGGAMRFGSYLGLVLMILYYGRRYYWGVVRGSVGLAPGGDVPAASLWAARLMVLALVGAIAMLVRWGGLDPLMATLLVAILMVIFLVLARINVETGLFYAQPDFLPGALLIGFFGFSGIGPEAMVALLLASVVFVADPREAVAPYLANGLRMSQTIGRVRIGRGALALGIMLTIGLIVAATATLTLQYDKGINPSDTFSNRYLPESVFNITSTAVAELSAIGELSASTGLGSIGHLRRADPMPGVVPWAATGLVLVLACAAARIRWTAWPIHPVLFIVWGTYPAYQFAFSFLLAAIVKWSVVKLGGVRTYHAVKPLMIGLIAAELLAVVGWSIVGSVYYLITGLTPMSYRIFPG